PNRTRRIMYLITVEAAYYSCAPRQVVGSAMAASRRQGKGAARPHARRVPPGRLAAVVGACPRRRVHEGGPGPREAGLAGQADPDGAGDAAGHPGSPGRGRRVAAVTAESP